MKTNLLSKLYLLSLSIGLVYSGFIQKTSFLKEGQWRGGFAQAQEIPFLFEVQGKGASNATVYLLNGTEKVPLTHVVQKKDSVFIPIENYDALLAAKIEKDQISGVYKRLNTGKPYTGIPFKAVYGEAQRFPFSKIKPATNINGKWEVNLLISATDTFKTVGILEQKGNYLTGTVLTNTGDYRYLEGNVQGDEFYLSAFNGSGPLLIKGNINPDHTLSGELITSGSKTVLYGFKNEAAGFPDGNKLNASNADYLLNDELLKTSLTTNGASGE